VSPLLIIYLPFKLCITYLLSSKSNIQLFCKKEQNNAQEIQTPLGFKYTPSDILRITFDQRLINLKNNWHMYIDKENYYLINPILGSNAFIAKKQGIIISGLTGKIIQGNQPLF
jgi:hypothetical protein